MKPTILFVAAALTTATLAQATPDLSRIQEIGNKNACFACHAVDHQVVGPAYRDVAERYRNDSGAADRLFNKVRTGGTGNWGQTAMPANTAISDADLHTMIDWILSPSK